MNSRQGSVYRIDPMEKNVSYKCSASASAICLIRLNIEEKEREREKKSIQSFFFLTS